MEVFAVSSLYSEGFYGSADGKSRIAYFIWSPETVPAGIIQISHGMNEYIGRYSDFALFLVSHGYVVCGNDHIGHGKSAGNDDDIGYIPRRGGADALVKDVHTLTKTIKEKFPGLPVFLLGHSMGSFIARLSISKYGSELAGAVISGTGGPGQPTGLGKFVSRLAGLTGQGRKRSKLIDKMAFGSYLKKMGNGASKFAWLTRDENIVDKYTKDKYCNSIFTADGFYTLFDMLGRVSVKKWSGTVPGTLPVLLVSGDTDPVGNYGKGPQIVYSRLKAAGVGDLTLKLYPGMRHEVLNETGRQQVYQDILDWITKRTVKTDVAGKESEIKG
jgi:alpha-beta hydrolase superfamily lysophospholipase